MRAHDQPGVGRVRHRTSPCGPDSLGRWRDLSGTRIHSERPVDRAPERWALPNPSRRAGRGALSTEFRVVGGFVALAQLLVCHANARHQIVFVGQCRVRDGARVGADRAANSAAHKTRQRMIGHGLYRLAFPVCGRADVEHHPLGANSLDDAWHAGADDAVGDPLDSEVQRLLDPRWISRFPRVACEVKTRRARSVCMTAIASSKYLMYSAWLGQSSGATM